MNQITLYMNESIPGETIFTPETVCQAMSNISHLDQESFWIIYLDCRNCLLEKELLFLGGIDSVRVDPRIIFKRAILKSATALILAHNHPSGDPKPSEGDLNITKQLKQGGQLLGIKVIEHIIVSKLGHFSFVENNLL